MRNLENRQVMIWLVVLLSSSRIRYTWLPRFQFNRSMRLLARKKGMSLNQRGLFEGVIRDPKTQNKLSKGRRNSWATGRQIDTT